MPFLKKFFMDQNNEDKFKVPAFMRKTEIKRRMKKKILFTALDRAQHEMMQACLSGRQAQKANKGYAAERGDEKSYGADFIKERIRRPKKPAVKRAQVANASDVSYGTSFLFGRDGALLPPENQTLSRVEGWKASGNLADIATQQNFENDDAPRVSLDYIGEISEYFSKIDVAVICLKRELKEGDVIVIGRSLAYRQAGAQVVESMQINRKTVQAAGPGDDIGLKLKQQAAVGDKVFLLNIL